MASPMRVSRPTEQTGHQFGGTRNVLGAYSLHLGACATRARSEVEVEPRVTTQVCCNDGSIPSAFVCVRGRTPCSRLGAAQMRYRFAHSSSVTLKGLKGMTVESGSGLSCGVRGAAVLAPYGLVLCPQTFVGFESGKSPEFKGFDTCVSAQTFADTALDSRLAQSDADFDVASWRSRAVSKTRVKQ